MAVDNSAHIFRIKFGSTYLKQIISNSIFALILITYNE